MDLLDDLILKLPLAILLVYETIVFCEIANIKHKLTSQDPCQIFHDFCHATSEIF